MFRLNVIWRAFALGYRREYRRAQVELRHEIEEMRRETEATIDHLRKADAEIREHLATVRAVHREIAQLRASHDITDAEHDEPTRLH